MTTRRSILIGGGALAVAAAGIGSAIDWDMGSQRAYDASVVASRAALNARRQSLDFIRYATRAASGHNTQPWRFRSDSHRIHIRPDFTRRTPVVDPDDHHLFVSLGCAAENLALSSAARGYPGEPDFDPAEGGSVIFRFSAYKEIGSALFDAIPKRQSSRTLYDGKPISRADLQALSGAAEVAGVEVVLITERQQMNRVRDLVVAGNSAQMADALFLRELKSWLRFNPRQAMETGDGLFSASSGVPSVPSWLGPTMVDWMFKPDSENDKYAGQVDSSAGIAVFVAEREDHEHWVLAGRACQRFALQATALGLKCAFINQPVEVASLRPELATLIGLPGRRPDLVMRFGSGPTLPYSARRPVADVVIA